MKKYLFILMTSLLFNGSIFAQEPEHHWIYDDAPYSNNMAVAFWVTLDGVYLDNTNIEVAAFVGDEVRMSAFLETLHPALAHMFIYQSIGLNNNGETITFKMYDHNNSKEYDFCTFTVIGEIDGTVGTVDDPIVLPFFTTYTKPITPYTGTGDHYYLIASPVGEVTPSADNGFLTNNYDLYYFDQTQEKEWRNYEQNAFTLVSGKGYLYASATQTTLTFTGTAYSDNGEVALVKDLNGSNATSGGFEGWNLVGNPFAQAAYIDRPFYRMNADGTELNSDTETGEIAIMEGVFVIATEVGEIMTFSTEAPTKGSEQLVVNLTQNRGASIDRAIVRFDEGAMLPKFMLNENNTKLYIPQGNHDYSVVRSAGVGVLPLNFKASKNGTYTLNIDTENVEMNYLHLIDNMTGADVDLLTNPSYTFEATTRDYASRFKLVFAGASTDAENFAFFNNGSWIINNDGKAILQIVDLNGRILCNEQINGCYSKNFKAAPGVYVLRLINGDNVKVQKVVVR